MLCKHGCGREAVYKDRCDKIAGRCPVIKKKNSESIKLCYKNGKLDTSHFDGKRG